MNIQKLRDLMDTARDGNLAVLLDMATSDEGLPRQEIIEEVLRIGAYTLDRINKEAAKVVQPPQYWNEYTEEEKDIYYEGLELEQEYFDDLKATHTQTLEALAILEATEAEIVAAIQTNEQNAAKYPPRTYTEAEQKEALELILQIGDADLKNMAEYALASLAANEEGTRH